MQYVRCVFSAYSFTCLVLGHQTMVCVVCLLLCSYNLSRYSNVSSKTTYYSDVTWDRSDWQQVRLVSHEVSIVNNLEKIDRVMKGLDCAWICDSESIERLLMTWRSGRVTTDTSSTGEFTSLFINMVLLLWWHHNMETLFPSLSSLMLSSWRCCTNSRVDGDLQRHGSCGVTVIFCLL